MKLVPVWRGSLKALVRSQGGVGTGVALSVPPTREITLPSHLFRVILLQCLRQARTLVPMWPSNRRFWLSLGCVCTSSGAQSKGFRGGEHLGHDLQRGASASAHQCMVRDMDFPQPDVHDGRGLEVVVDGLPLRGGAQLAVATMVCALHRDGRPRRGAVDHDGVALTAARRKKERTYPELPWTSEEGSACGYWRGSRGTMVSRNEVVLHPVGQSSCPK